MHFIGIDIGSTSSKVAVMDERGEFCELFLLPSGFSAVKVARQTKQNLEQKGYGEGFVTATGYGRVSVEYAQLSMSEILCHGLGAHFLFEPDCTVEGVGGQDTKAIKTLNGKPADFIMNDKCSAGTGKFLEISAGRLGLELSEIYKTARKNPTIKLSPYARYLPRPSWLSANIGVNHVTVTVNAVTPEVGGKIYAWVRHGNRIYRGEKGAKILGERQEEGIRKLKEARMIVKINTVVIPGVNMDHVPRIAKKAKEWQADIMNCMAMIPVHGTPFANIKSPSNEEIRSMRRLIGGSIHQMTHCSRCRADACGKLCEK